MTHVYTIIVPTRERSDTLYWTLRTCTMQDFDRLTILVSDNASTDNTEAVVRSFNDPRIKYIRTPQRLEMSGNWEFALQHVNEGYVTFLGDDDGFLPGSVQLADAIIHETQTGAVCWYKAGYQWPMHINPWERNLLGIAALEGIEWRNSVAILKEICGWRLAYGDLPCLYNSFVDINILKKTRDALGGRFFRSINPDVFSGFAVVPFLNQFIHCSMQLSIGGTSHHSIGSSHHTNDTSKSVAGSKFKSELTTSWEEDLPFVMLDAFSIAESLLKAGRAYPTAQALYHFEWRDVITAAVKEVAVKRRDVYDYALPAVQELAAKNSLLDLFQSLTTQYPWQGPNEFRSHGVSPGMSEMMVDLSLFGGKTIYDACLFAGYFLKRISVQEFSARWKSPDRQGVQ